MNLGSFSPNRYFVSTVIRVPTTVQRTSVLGWKAGLEGWITELPNRKFPALRPERTWHCSPNSEPLCELDFYGFSHSQLLLLFPPDCFACSLSRAASACSSSQPDSPPSVVFVDAVNFPTAAAYPLPPRSFHESSRVASCAKARGTDYTPSIMQLGRHSSA